MGIEQERGKCRRDCRARERGRQQWRAHSTRAIRIGCEVRFLAYLAKSRFLRTLFATLRDRAASITRVVLIGPAHYVHIQGIAAPTVDAFLTPVGCVPVDVEGLSAIDDLQFVVRTDAPHAPEHSLEVELPFLQTILTSFEVVPLVVSDTRYPASERLIDADNPASPPPMTITCGAGTILISKGPRRRGA